MQNKIESMEGAMWIALVTVVIGIVLYIMELIHRRRQGAEVSADGAETPDGGRGISYSEADNEDGESNNSRQEDEGSSECCGLHLVCEKDTLSPVSDEIIYYDDEELDRYIGRTAESYNAEETEEFRDVLMTLLPEDVAGWARSITQRRLELPADVRDELLILVNEQRAIARAAK